MKIQFVYCHCGEKKSAKDVAKHPSKDYFEYKWKTWTRKNFRARSVIFKETLQIEMDVMHSFHINGIKNSVQREAGAPVEILIDGKTPLQYCAWAQYWFRKLEREHTNLKYTFK